MVAPRRNACSRSSRISAPEPSPITNPSRSESNGRDASVGRSLNFVDRAVICAKATSAMSTNAASAPPATMASASPSWIARKARPIAWLDAAQAVVVQKFGPRRPSAMAMCPAAAFGMSWGTVKGETRLGPLVCSTLSLASRELIPPMPVANSTPVSSLSTLPSMPASCQASRAAVKASWVDRSSRRASFVPSVTVGSKSVHSAATLEGTSSGSTRVKGPTPERPAVMASQYALTPTPTGVTAPVPVTTTRRTRLPHRGLLGDHQVRRFANGLHTGDLVVRDLDAELLLESQDDLDQVERVGVEVLLEASVGRDLVGVDAELGGEDFPHGVDDFIPRLRHLALLLRASCWVQALYRLPRGLPADAVRQSSSAHLPTGPGVRPSRYAPMVMPPSIART